MNIGTQETAVTDTTVEVGMSLTDAICDATSYGRNSANDASFSFGQANMFCNAQAEGNGDMRRSIETNLAKARRAVEAQLRLLEDAERALSGPMNESRIEYLHRTTIDMDALRAIPRQPVSPHNLGEQLRALEVLGNRFGLNDAVDTLRRARDPSKTFLPFAEVCDLNIVGAIKQYSQVQTANCDQLQALEYVADAFGLKRAANELRRMLPL